MALCWWCLTQSSLQATTNPATPSSPKRENATGMSTHYTFIDCYMLISLQMSYCHIDCLPCLLRVCLHRCKLCPLTFFSKSDMQIHSKSHTEVKPHKCPHCSKSFANASYLGQHLRIHLGVKPYHCSYCEKCFRQLSHLQQHTRSNLWTYLITSLIVFSCTL